MSLFLKLVLVRRHLCWCYGDYDFDCTQDTW